MAVKMYNGDEFFTRCCKAAEIQPTKRQFKKFIDEKGTAFAKGRPIILYADSNKISDDDAKVRWLALGSPDLE